MGNIVVEEKDLDILKRVKIFVSAGEEEEGDKPIKEGWYSLRELYDMGHGNEAYLWFMEQIWDQLGLKPGGGVKPTNIVAMVKLLRKLDIKAAR